MTEPGKARVLYVIVCGAGPASEIGRLVELAQQRAWDVQVIATPAALEFIDVPDLQAQTGRPVRSRYRTPGQPRSPKADAIIVAPATYNTVNKWAAGISDTYALGILAEAPGLHIPTVLLPFVNTALAGRNAFRRSVDDLRRASLVEAQHLTAATVEVADDRAEALLRRDHFHCHHRLEQLRCLHGQRGEMTGEPLLVAPRDGGHQRRASCTESDGRPGRQPTRTASCLRASSEVIS